MPVCVPTVLQLLPFYPKGSVDLNSLCSLSSSTHLDTLPICGTDLGFLCPGHNLIFFFTSGVLTGGNLSCFFLRLKCGVFIVATLWAVSHVKAHSLMLSSGFPAWQGLEATSPINQATIRSPTFSYYGLYLGQKFCCSASPPLQSWL